MTSMENKDGYKKTKLGWIPEEWEIIKLGKLGKLTSGTTPSRAKQKEYFDDGRHYWIKTTDLNNSEISYTEEMVTDLAIKETSLKFLPKHTLLIAMYGGFKQIGRTGLVVTPSTINQALSAIVLEEKLCSPKYCLHFLNSFVWNWRRFAASSRKDPNITKTDVSQFPIIIPPLPEQQKIATILSTWDKAINKLSDLIDAKEEQKKGLMQRLLTGRLRLKGFDGEWQERKLGEIFNERKETKREDLELLSIGSKGVYPQSESNKKDTSNKNKEKYKRICRGDIGYNTMRMWQGRSAISTLEGIVSPAYTIVTPKKGNHVRFYGYLFHTPDLIHRFWRYSQGLVGDTLNCKFKSFSKVKVLVPPTIEEQKKIASVLDQISLEIKTLEKKRDIYELEKKGLMQQLLTGRTRVKIK